MPRSARQHRQDTSLLEALERYEGPLLDEQFLERVIRKTIELKCEVIDVDPNFS